MSDSSPAAAPLVIEGTAGLQEYTGREIGTSRWLSFDQDQIQRFADATGDHQWIHVDVERARRESPFGGPIAHGYLVLSVGPKLAWEIFTVSGMNAVVNYGADKVRFLAPVPSGANVRLRTALADLREHAMGVLAAFDWTFELEGSQKPACVARVLSLYAE